MSISSNFFFDIQHTQQLQQELHAVFTAIERPMHDAHDVKSSIGYVFTTEACTYTVCLCHHSCGTCTSRKKL